MISTYRRVLSVPGALAFSLSGLVARLPISMVSLGIVLLVSARTGSYGLAGGVSASYLVAGAAFAVLQARLVDRYGQGRVLSGAVVLFSVGLALMTFAVQSGWPVPLPHLFAALAGATLPQIGSSVRARWSHVLADKRMLQTAFAFEAAVDESVFMIGPTLVTFLATAVHPTAGLTAAVVAAVAGTFALVSQRRTEPPPRSTRRARGQGPMGWAVLGPLVVSAVALGVLFGAVEVSTVAFSQEQGNKALSGVVLAVFALGSLLSGLVTGALQIRASNAARYRWGLLALSVAMLPLPFVRGFPLLGLLLFVAGFTISPTLIASVAWVEETVPAGRLTEGIATLTTGLSAGVAPGAAVAGWVIDRYGASLSFWVPVCAGLLGVVVAFGASVLPRFRARASSPT